MNPVSTLSNKKMGLDRKVWMVMLVTCILCLGLFGYKIINGNEPCTPTTLSINAIPAEKEAVHYVDEPLTFKAPLAANKKIVWDFGDKTSSEEGFIVTHTYKKEGEFRITAVINGRCENYARINIKKHVEISQSLNNYNISEKIVGSSIINVGKEEKFTYAGGATSYEWTVKNSSNFPTQTTPTASFNFSLPGPYTIQLVVNNDPSKKGYKEITVIDPAASATQKSGGGSKSIPMLIPANLPPLPNPADRQSDRQADKQPEKQAEKQPEKAPEKQPDVTAEPAKKKVVFIHDQIFQSLLEGVVTGQKDVDDFDPYLIYGGATKVRVNDGKIYKTFSQLCQEIKGRKVIIESVKLKRDENDKTVVMQIEVDYKKKGFLGL
jgi:hypothetical protein